MTSLFLLWAILATVTTVFSVKKALELSEISDQLMSDVTEALEVLASMHEEISQLASTEVMSDEPTIRNAVATLQKARDAVSAVGTSLEDYKVKKESEISDA